MPAIENYTLYSGGLKGAESAFGEAAEQWGINEVNFTFSGQKTWKTRRPTGISAHSPEGLLRPSFAR